MAIKPSPKDTTLTITRTFNAKREAVFKAWTDPQALIRWFAPSDDFATPVVDVDLRVGGRYRIQMKAPDGGSHTVHGTYREVTPPTRLVFTWAWEEGSCRGEMPPEQETLVTVEFHDRGGATELILTHEYFPTVKVRDSHEEGWNGCLNRLPKAI